MDSLPRGVRQTVSQRDRDHSHPQPHAVATAAAAATGTTGTRKPQTSRLQPFSQTSPQSHFPDSTSGLDKLRYIPFALHCIHLHPTSNFVALPLPLPLPLPCHSTLYLWRLVVPDTLFLVRSSISMQPVSTFVLTHVF